METRGRGSRLVDVVRRNVEDLTRSFERNNNHFVVFHEIRVNILRVFSDEIGFIVGVVHEIGEIDIVFDILLLLGCLWVKDEGNLRVRGIG